MCNLNICKGLFETSIKSCKLRKQARKRWFASTVQLKPKPWDAALQNASFPALTQIGGDLTVTYLARTQSIAFPVLNRINATFVNLGSLSAPSILSGKALQCKGVRATCSPVRPAVICARTADLIQQVSAVNTMCLSVWARWRLCCITIMPLRAALVLYTGVACPFNHAGSSMAVISNTILEWSLIFSHHGISAI